VIARIRVKVRRREEAGAIISEETHTVVVDPNGAIISLAMAVRPGDTLTLEHLISREEKEIRVVRVADKQSQVAVEFTSSAPRFWHIDCPP
jgi:hypothetical protein